MKKEKTISVLIRIADSPVRPKNLLFSLTGCFALLFLGGLGFFSSVKDMSAVPGAVSFWIFPLAGVALLLTFLFGLFLLHKKKRLALLLSGGLLCSLLLFQRKALLAQGSSFLGYLHARLERFYGISLFSGFSGSAADNSLFFFFCTLLFLILVCLTLWYRKKVLFFCWHRWHSLLQKSVLLSFPPAVFWSAFSCGTVCLQRKPPLDSFRPDFFSGFTVSAPLC